MPFNLLVIAGPTGSGKSALALALAKRLGGEIVNYDSVQVYRGLDIGSAKTPAAERCGIPHHLFDVIPVTEELTAGAYARLARQCLAEISSRSALPILVGGTGFYLRSLLDGLSEAPTRNPDLRLRLNALAERQPPAIYRFLRRMDRAAALRIHPNDHQKLIRAVELAAAAPPAPRNPLTGFRVLKLGLNADRAQLYERLNRRSAAMFAEGLLDETAGLLASGVAPDCKALQSLGYKQAVAVVQGRMGLPEAIVEVQTRTRQYAKRQMTWFRREAGLKWLEGFGEDVEVQRAAFGLVMAGPPEFG